MTIRPSAGLWTAKPVPSADALKMLSVRSNDETSAAVLHAAGARATFLPFDEALSKVRAHELNAILTAGDGGAGRKLWDELCCFSAVNDAIPISLAFVRRSMPCRGRSRSR